MTSSLDFHGPNWDVTHCDGSLANSRSLKWQSSVVESGGDLTTKSYKLDH